MKTRITQADIARAAGVHNTTVSLALRNSRLLPSATRARIRAIAQRMGYAPDPALTALAAYRNARRPHRHPSTLAFVSAGAAGKDDPRQPWLQLYLAGARRKASELGFALEHHTRESLAGTGTAWARALEQREITGVILSSGAAGAALEKIDWSRLSVVGLGAFSPVPALNHVTVDYAGLMNLAIHRIRAARYRRVGFVLSRWWNEIAGQSWSKMFYARQAYLPVNERLPVLYLGSHAPGIPGGRPADDALQDVSDFVRWFRAYRPDVVVGLAPGIQEHFERLGLDIPDDVAFADLLADRAPAGTAGVRQHAERAGELAVEILSGQLQRGEMGLPRVATITSVTGSWVDGTTLPRLNQPAPAAEALVGADRMAADLVA
ncbi:MAG TPA: LacI family DNA-binding transcriptional regulator [Lacunisphaera sp.]|nr:LacI family DNA-binding transcriptional regulator [Lacunisphaera sp.]